MSFTQPLRQRRKGWPIQVLKAPKMSEDRPYRPRGATPRPRGDRSRVDPRRAAFVNSVPELTEDRRCCLRLRSLFLTIEELQKELDRKEVDADCRGGNFNDVNQGETRQTLAAQQLDTEFKGYCAKDPAGNNLSVLTKSQDDLLLRDNAFQKEEWIYQKKSLMYDEGSLSHEDESTYGGREGPKNNNTCGINQEQFRRHRRGRRSRQMALSTGHWEEKQAPFEREFLFRPPNTKPSMPGIVHLDSQCSIPFIVSRRWVKEAGRESDMSTNFKAPDSYSISGHRMKFCGIIRNMSFMPKGSTLTFRRDFLVSEQLDTVMDFIIGAKFMVEQWSLLFRKMKKMIAVWFTKKKETPEERDQGQILKDDQEQKAQEAERRRREKKAQEAREREARRQERGGNDQDENRH